MISLDVDIPQKKLRAAGDWLGNYMQDSLFAVSAFLNRASE